MNTELLLILECIKGNHPSTSSGRTANRVLIVSLTVRGETETVHGETETVHGETETVHGETETVHGETETVRGEPVEP